MNYHKLHLIIIVLVLLSLNACGTEKPTPGYVEGKVTLEGEPITDVFMKLGEMETKTDKNGRYAFTIESFQPDPDRVYSVTAWRIVGIEECRGSNLFQIESAKEGFLNIELNCKTSVLFEPAPFELSTPIVIPTPFEIPVIPTLFEMPVIPTPIVIPTILKSP